MTVLTPCRTLLLAGHDTSGTTLTWFFWELAKHPESAREIREEIAAVRARIGPRDFSISDLEGMTTMLTAFKVPPSFRHHRFLSSTKPAGVDAASSHRLATFEKCCARRCHPARVPNHDQVGRADLGDSHTQGHPHRPVVLFVRSVGGLSTNFVTVIVEDNLF